MTTRGITVLRGGVESVAATAHAAEAAAALVEHLAPEAGDHG